MKVWSYNEPRVVDIYLHASCFNEINKEDFEEMLDYELKADPVERKLIERVKDQVRQGKIDLTMQVEEKVDHSNGNKVHIRMSTMKASLA